MPETPRQTDQRSDAARAYRRLYKSARWKRERHMFLQDNPLCAMCPDESKRAATVVDHIEPHRGDLERFWDHANWQPLCAPHHNRSAQQQDVRGYHGEIDADGNPKDPNHPFNR